MSCTPNTCTDRHFDSMHLRYGGETAYRVLVHMTGYDVMILDRPLVRGDRKPMDPETRTPNLQILEMRAATPAAPRGVSISEANMFAAGEEPIIIVEHNGEGGAGGHFSAYRRQEGLERGKVPRQLQEFIAQYKKDHI